ncbi:MAG: tetratricopeptide repeat protein [Acidobacteria bacterium]|nr:tetratricopeptide repeat protein [Acidobacteriota bacterium]
MTEYFRGAARIAAAALFVLAFTVAASAQTGQIRGKVVDAKGQPVADAIVKIDFKGNITRAVSTKTDKKGSFIQVGLASGPYEITVSKDNLSTTQNNRVSVGSTTELEFVLAPGAAPNATAEDAKIADAKRKALQDKYVAAIGLVDAGKYDEGIAALNAVITELGSCAVCQVKIGDAQWKKGDEAAAEASYKAAIAADPKIAESYGQLASLYNKQKKFDDAAAMSAKANELAGAGTAGGGNASVIFNQGIIFWNQSKVPEAKAQFEQAVKIDPTLADAHYWLGMARVNEGDMPGAKASFEQYLKLAPTGQHAATAKGILDSIK